MWKNWLLGSVMALAPLCAMAQLKTVPLTDEQITHDRVGNSFDKAELEYFGLFQAFATDSSVTKAFGISKKDTVVVDSARYGYASGSFYIEPYVRGNPKKILLSPAAQNEFFRLVAQYEPLAENSKNLNIGLLNQLRVHVPLYHHETQGQYTEAAIGKQLYFGEVAFVTLHHIGLYDVDLGYEADIARQELKILNLDSVEVFRVYNHNLARYIGLGIGAAVAGTFTAFGFYPVDLGSDQAQVAANFIVLPALGFGVGFLIDKTFSINSDYQMSDVRRAPKGLKRLRSHAIFKGKLPPEINHKLPAPERR